MTIRRRRTKVAMTSAAVAVFAAVGFETAFGSMTSIQDNGTACLADYRNPTASMWRNSAGLENTGAGSMGVYCPLTRASGDSYSAGSGSLNSLEVFYTGDAPTNCDVRYRSTTGAITMSPPLVAGTSATAPGVPVMKLTSSFGGAGLSPALGLRCDLPSLTTLVGIIHTDDVPNVTGGS